MYACVGTHKDIQLRCIFCDGTWSRAQALIHRVPKGIGVHGAIGDGNGGREEIFVGLRRRRSAIAERVVGGKSVGRHWLICYGHEGMRSGQRDWTRALRVYAVSHGRGDLPPERGCIFGSLKRCCVFLTCVDDDTDRVAAARLRRTRGWSEWLSTRCRLACGECVVRVDVKERERERKREE